MFDEWKLVEVSDSDAVYHTWLLSLRKSEENVYRNIYMTWKLISGVLTISHRWKNLFILRGTCREQRLCYFYFSANTTFLQPSSYIFFWGNSSQSSTIFLLQKKAIRAMLGYDNTVSCRNIFKELNILSFASQYIFSFLVFVLQNKVLFLSNTDSHTINTLRTGHAELRISCRTVSDRTCKFAVLSHVRFEETV
jgi:hypothetical protein